MPVLRRFPRIHHRYIIYVLLTVSVTIIYFLFKWNFLCSNIQAWQHVKKICRLYQEGRGAGTLCAPLCTTNEINSLTCHSFRSTKEAVFSANWHKVHLVFKSSDAQPLHWFNNGRKTYPSERELTSAIRAVVKRKFNVTLSFDVASRLSRLRPSYEETNREKRQIEMDNVWNLVQDNEYLLSVIYKEKDVFPQLLGTCGPYFAVEYLQPIEDVSSVLKLSDSREDWGKRLRISIQILHLLEELEEGFREPLHLCDIKLEHFGFIEGGSKLKFMDLDGVYPKSVVSKIIENDCQEDGDCDFRDCRSKCFDGKCGRIHNNNLQIVCEKIFLGWRLSNTVIVPGLLLSQHTPSELASLLRQCANPESESGKPRAVPEEFIKKRLVNILVEVERSVNDDFFLK